MITFASAALVRSDQLDGPVYINQPDIVELTRDHPGQVFVGTLPGHSRPAFVRKRRSSCFGLPKLFNPRHSYSEERYYRRVVRSPSRYPSESHHTSVYTDQPVFVCESGPRPLPAYAYLAPRPSDRTGKHTCGACGKFRSPSYCKRHPLADGETPKPSLCRKCAKGSTDTGSDDSYAKYKKEQKRRRRWERESTDERYERCRRERRYSKRRPHSSSADYSYEHYREGERYRGPRRIYSVDERSSYSEQEPRRKPRIIYCRRSSSRRYTDSSSCPSLVISYKSRAPERRRRSRSRSMSERSYRHHYHSRSRSSGEKSVRFRSPVRESRRRCALGLDGELAASEDASQAPGFAGSKLIEMPHDEGSAASGQVDHVLAQDKDASKYWSSDESERAPRRRRIRYVRSSSESRGPGNRLNARGWSSSSNLALMTGARGRSLSSEREAFERATSRERSSGRSRRSSSVRYSTSSDEHIAYRVTQVPTRTSRLMLRLLQENPEHFETVYDKTPTAEQRTTYRHVRSRSPKCRKTSPRLLPNLKDPSSHDRGRTLSRRQSLSCDEEDTDVSMKNQKEMRHRTSEEESQSRDSLAGDFGGRVRYVKAPQG